MALTLVVRRIGDAPDSPAAATYAFAQSRVMVGRSPGADVQLPQLAVSDVHAVLEEALGKIFVSDQGSTNGTRINGIHLVPKRARALVDGDELEIGDFVISFNLAPLVAAQTSKERTASLAKKLLCDLLGGTDDATKAPTLAVVEGADVGTVVELATPPSALRIGRDDEAELTLRDADASRFHAVVERDLDGALVRDLESKNGLEVNGKRLRERRLRDGDRIRIGVSVIAYEDPAERALKSLEGQRDVPVTRTRPQLPFDDAVLPALPAPVAQAPTLPPTQPVGALDAAVYALAVLILGASLLGLWWLFGA